MIKYIKINFNLLLLQLNNKSLYVIFNKTNKYFIKLNYICKDIVLYSGNNFEFLYNFLKLTLIVRNMYNILNDLLYIIVGIILSDGYIEHTNKNNLQNSIFNKDYILNINNLIYNNSLITKHNCRLKFKQSIIHFDYFMSVYQLLKGYTSRYLYIVKTKIKGKIYYGMEFYTVSLLVFSILRKLFYNGRIKIILKSIYDIIDYVTIAHLIMGDGACQDKGITLNLQAFTLKELIYLMHIFNIKFDINCNIHKSRNQYVIYITTKSLKKLFLYIKQYIHLSMEYKLKQFY